MGGGKSPVVLIKGNMNEEEKTAAKALLEKMQITANANEAVQLANAYQALCQGAFNRKQAEITGNN